MKRKIIQLIVDDEVKAEINSDIYSNQIDEFCWVLANDLDIDINDIKIKTIECDISLSDFDVTNKGLVNWKDANFKNITGISCAVELGSDEHLDCIIDGITLEKFLFLS